MAMNATLEKTGQGINQKPMPTAQEIEKYPLVKAESILKKHLARSMYARATGVEGIFDVDQALSPGPTETQVWKAFTLMKRNYPYSIDTAGLFTFSMYPSVREAGFKAMEQIEAFQKIMKYAEHLAFLDYPNHPLPYGCVSPARGIAHNDGVLLKAISEVDMKDGYVRYQLTKLAHGWNSVRHMFDEPSKEVVDAAKKALGETK